jgi:exonuclease VII small subunit
MLTALLYAVQTKHLKLDASVLTKARNDGYAEGVARTQEGTYEKAYRELQERVEAFDKASGIDVQYGWKVEKIGEAVRVIMSGDSEIKRLLSQAKYGVQSAERLKTELQNHADILESVLSKLPQEKDEEE